MGESCHQIQSSSRALKHVIAASAFFARAFSSCIRHGCSPFRGRLYSCADIRSQFIFCMMHFCCCAKCPRVEVPKGVLPPQLPSLGTYLSFFSSCQGIAQFLLL